ncbi:MAG: glycoside hydrolase family 15 protein [Candidatus Angelobacter sp.]
MLSPCEKPPKINDYAVIGDCRSAALVSRYGSVDWLAWPRLDSPSIFAAILDRDKGGFWSISPVGPCQFERAYIRDSNVVNTKFISSTGTATLTDLMPVASEEFKRQHMLPDHEILRQIVCTEGEMRLEVAFCPRPYYGTKQVRIQNLGANGLRLNVGRGAYFLRSSVPLEIGRNDARTTLSLNGGDVLQFSLTYSEESPSVLSALGENTRASIERSVRWWQEWAAQAKYQGPYRDAVVRSALALKLLSYAPSGAITAAVTTSLPERIGAGLNWDYRYCWLRDASLTMRALLGLGYMEETESFITWLLHATRLTQPRLHVLYNVFGGIAPRERELDLAGYFGSQPVRIGNAARHQLQLDVYGEVIEAAAQYAERHGRFDRTTQKVLIGFGKYVAAHWSLADEGIWEPRSGRADNTYSRLLCWAALDRLLALGDKGLVDGVPRQEFEVQRERIRQQIKNRAWNESLQSYVSVLDGNGVDATLLRIPWYGFEEAQSPRMKSTYRKIRQELSAGDSLLFRYRSQPAEGAFGICGFWAVEYLALGGGTLQEAHHLFDHLLKYGNDLGLFAEEIDPETGDALGNFPQAFTHIGLISAALTLEEKERGESHPAARTGQNVEPNGREVTS